MSTRLILMTVTALLGAACGAPAASSPGADPVVRSPEPSRPAAESATTSPSPPSPAAVPRTGPGTFAYAAGTGPLIGDGGTLMRFRVAVEHGTGEDPAAVAGFVEATLADPRGWTAGGGWRFQRTASGPYDFTVYVATPATTDRLCAPLRTQGEVSCRQGERVVLNLARWRTGVRHYDADLETYRRYLVNHEIGHRLGHGHELCPGDGRWAPVMQQQTLTLRGCRGNPWPYLNGARHQGPPGSYD